MKKFFSAILIVISISCFAQPSKWFVSFSVGGTLAGPSASLKKQMIAQGLDQTSNTNILGFAWSNDYPEITKDVALIVRAGTRLNERRSLYFTAGRSANATVKGFRNDGYTDLFLFGGSYGYNVSVDYKVYQLTGGYLYSFPKTGIKLGFGPGLYVLHYQVKDNFVSRGKNSSLVAGASFLARLPFGKEKRLIGTEFVFEGNMAPPAKMKMTHADGDFRTGNANIVHFTAGLALTIRKRQ